MENKLLAEVFVVKKKQLQVLHPPDTLSEDVGIILWGALPQGELQTPCVAWGRPQQPPVTCWSWRRAGAAPGEAPGGVAEIARALNQETAPAARAQHQHVWCLVLMGAEAQGWQRQPLLCQRPVCKSASSGDCFPEQLMALQGPSTKVKISKYLREH